LTYLTGPPPPTQVDTYRADLGRTGYYPSEINAPGMVQGEVTVRNGVVYVPLANGTWSRSANSRSGSPRAAVRSRYR
jgi:hypothetical protein